MWLTIYNGGPIGLAGKPHAACVDYVRRVDTQHRNQGWSGIGYSFLACPHGHVFEGRGLDRQQAAQPGGNATWYSIQMMVGGNERPTVEQIQAWRDCRTYIRQRRAVAATIRGHYQFVSTSCPGTPTKRLIADGTLAGTGLGRPITSPPVGSGTVPHMTAVRSVRNQQTAVNGLGYKPALLVDGIFGKLTLAGVEWLQGQLGVTVDGLWGKLTEASYLKRISAPAPAPKPPPDRLLLVVDSRLGGLTAKAVQRALKVKADGVWGPVTVRAMQRRCGLTGSAVDGRLGPQTTRAVQRRVGQAGRAVTGTWPSIRSVSSAGIVVFNSGAVSATTRELQKAVNANRF